MNILTTLRRKLLAWGSGPQLGCRHPGGGAPYKKRSFGTPSGSGPQSQIAVAQLSHEASLHKRSAEPLWRFAPAIHGLRDFPEALPASGASADFVRACSTASEQCVFVVVFLALSPLRLSFLHERHGALSAFRVTDRSGELPGGSIQ